MKSLWSDTEANRFAGDDLAMRVYSSCLLGQDPSLVLHGGGNTSVKSVRKDIFGHESATLYIKGSGQDLASIKKSGFTPVALDKCLKLAALETLSDIDMVEQLRLASLQSSAPDGSIETLVHAVIPYKYIDHTHADAVIVITNSGEGQHKLGEIFPDFLILPYVKPGFDLTKQIYSAINSGEMEGKRGIILRGHGIFSFAESAKESYECMIEAITRAEDAIASMAEIEPLAYDKATIDCLELARIRKKVSELRGKPVILKLDQSARAVALSRTPNAEDIVTRGPLTPDHCIRTKPIPAFIDENIETELEAYRLAYLKYFKEHAQAEHVCLDPAPRWAVWKDRGILSFGATRKETNIISDIARHTAGAIQYAEALGGWQPLTSKDLFDIEYWELEQRKLKRHDTAPEFQGRVAMVTGAATGIGRKCVDDLLRQGASVVGLDISLEVEALNSGSSDDCALGLMCDITDGAQLTKAVEHTLSQFGGLDILICNAGIFIAGDKVEDLPDEIWEQTLKVNLTAHQRLIKQVIPYLKQGMEPAVVLVGSRNVHAPGPGASAYSVSKAGLTQLGRVLAMELARDGIRINVVHPDAVFDTDLWTTEKLEASSARYGMSVEEYKSRNLLGTEIKSTDVAALCIALCSALFSKTTGAQIPIDGGNDCVI